MNRLAEKISMELVEENEGEQILPEVSQDQMEIDTTVTWRPKQLYDILPPRASFFERF